METAIIICKLQLFYGRNKKSLSRKRKVNGIFAFQLSQRKVEIWLFSIIRKRYSISQTLSVKFENICFSCNILGLLFIIFSCLGSVVFPQLIVKIIYYQYFQLFLIDNNNLLMFFQVHQLFQLLYQESTLFICHFQYSSISKEI